MLPADHTACLAEAGLAFAVVLLFAERSAHCVCTYPGPWFQSYVSMKHKYSKESSYKIVFSLSLQIPGGGGIPGSSQSEHMLHKVHLSL